jgi:hypothetical protein
VRIGSAALVLVLVCAGAARAEDTVENPEYASWSKFNKGTSVTLKSTITIRDKPSEQALTFTLVEVADDKVVVTLEVVIKVQGEVLKANPVREEIPKKLKLAKGQKKEDALASKPEGTFDEGKETLKVGGVETKTRWFKFKTTSARGTVTEGQVWVSSDVPGVIVKRHETSGGQVPVTSVTDLIEIKKP